ncbi:MAG: DUF2298 domain-containing protein [Anaerolineaceae bacterium]|nr:DUF2298 domain-containing protein [Anaerolineaceae bacterium]
MADLQLSEPQAEPDQKSQTRTPWIYVILLVGILLAGAYFRFIGINWDDHQHLHPDERFLTMVETAISPVSNVSDYFNTAVSSLNPNNRGYSFFVYGTLPIFIVRYAAELWQNTGYDQVYLVGRFLSGTIDLMTVVLVFLTARQLYRKNWLALLAAAFYACAVLPIQLSHYFAVDSFTGFFTLLALYFAILILTGPVHVPRPVPVEAGEEDDEAPAAPRRAWIDAGLKYYLLFGAALGMAMASKVSAAPLALALPLAALVYLSRLERQQRRAWLLPLLRNLVLGAVAAFLVFRIFQPYAFSGPGFFGLQLNQNWLDNLRELSQQSGGDVDFPPALQWARRPFSFAFVNILYWGLGLPLGILAWAGFLAMGWRMLKGEWRRHILLWSWTAVYFIWQSINFSRNMRYQNLIYPALAIMAAWLVFMLWERSGNLRWDIWRRRLALAIGAVVLLGSVAWAYAFTRIYTRPVTRVAASTWIYQNIPVAINLPIESGDGSIPQLIAFQPNYTLASGNPWTVSFVPKVSGPVSSFEIAHILNTGVTAEGGPATLTLLVTLQEEQDGPPLTSGTLVGDFQSNGVERGQAYEIPFTQPIPVQAGRQYFLILQVIEPDSALSLAGSASVSMLTPEGKTNSFLVDPADAIYQDKDYIVLFTALQSGTIRQALLPHIVDWEAAPQEKTLTLSLGLPDTDEPATATAQATSQFQAGEDPRGQAYTLQLDRPFQVEKGQTYQLRLHVDGPGKIAAYGSRQAIESSWDDSLPLGMPGYNPYDFNQGVYRSELNFEMYWDDNADKLDRFLDILDQADYIFITSNRQWATTTRVPERYPLTTAYYRELLGCPPEQDLLWCYQVAQPGMFTGDLGFELTQVFQSEPTLGNIQINTQSAEESFTVYDHPKVLIFKKMDAYDWSHVRQLLSSVDLSQVIHVTPAKVGSYPANLMLPEDRLAGQRSGGTWSELFPPGAIFNQYPGVGAVLWYLAVFLLGVIVYPSVRLALRGLPDQGYPLARLLGMLLLSYLVWLAGSAKIPFDKATISAAVLLLVLVNLVLAYLQREGLRAEWKQRKKYFLVVEALALASFVLFLLVRLGNPDLWHPYKGGEKPMDFSYFNAVLRSTTFPPYDPWFAGGYINYYYYGFVLSGVLVKWIGITPSVAYNLILPTFFCFVALGAFSFGWNLFAREPAEDAAEAPATFWQQYWSPLLAGLASSLGLLVLGNLGTVRMIWQGLQRLAAVGPIEGANIFQHWMWTFQGLVRFIQGATLPYGPGDWYWIPSRAIPNEPITEFPLFTFLYADPHAHLFALPLTILALGWALSFLKNRWQWGDGVHIPAWLHFLASFAAGGLVIGSLRPTNTWDLPTYLAIGCVVVIYTAISYSQERTFLPHGLPAWARRILTALLGVALLFGLSWAFFLPYSHWYGQGYTTFGVWEGDHTPFWSYVTHWGLFLFILITWMLWETREWMASTPVSHLNRLRPFRVVIEALLVALVAAVVVLLFTGVQIAWLALPVAVWAAVLILRPGQSAEKRLVLFMVGSALVLSLGVELVVLEGDVGRMNTVFKFYLQAWTLFALSSGAALMWLAPAVARQWLSQWRSTWQVALAVLVGCAALFPLMGGADKIRDRMSSLAPHTLDGMTYMAYSTYAYNGVEMDLRQDYEAIRWMQENVQGSPVIVEANTTEYLWGSRFTIYTGLPGVLGWNWHQRQQRAIAPTEWVWDRVNAIDLFYKSIDETVTRQFLQQYDVEYIVVGQLERAMYTGFGIEKFDAWNGELWDEVYRQGDTVIYRVRS